MRTYPESPTIARARYIFVGVLFLVLLALALVGGVLKAGMDSRIGAPDTPTAAYNIVIFTFWAAIVLVTPALCFHIFSNSAAPNTYWRAFWTAAFLAFAVHVYSAVTWLCGGDWGVVFNSKVATPEHPECLVEHPGPDVFFLVWWALDVALAWIVSDNNKWLRAQRGALHIVAFTMFFGAAVLAEKAEIVARLLGLLMALAVLGCLALRLIVQENDPKSLTVLVYDKVFEFLNLFVTWDKLPIFFGVLNLGALRDVLREKNLHNTSDIAVTEPNGLRQTVPYDPRYLCEREEDGQWNNLAKPTMGNASFNPNDPSDSPDYTLSNPGARFGRNIPLTEVDPTRDGDLLDPSPRLVSNRLLGRAKKSDGTDDFTPATILNLLAAAWIQFQTHNWFNHGTPRPIDDDPFDVPIPPGDSWPAGKMLVRRTRADPTRKANDHAGPTTFTNAEPHWWDSSQIYGTSPQAGSQFRSGVNGKLNLDPKTKLIPLEFERRRNYRHERELVAGLKPAAQSLHARAQRHLRSPGGSLSGMAQRSKQGRRDFPRRAPCQQRPDRENPHGRLDARDPHPPGLANRHERQLVGTGRGKCQKKPRPHQHKRSDQRHSRLGGQSVRRRLLSDRGIRLGLSPASAAAE